MPRYSATGVYAEVEPENANIGTKGFNLKYKETTLKPGDLTDSDTKTNIIVKTV